MSLPLQRQDELFEFAQLVHSIARRLPAPDDLQPGPCTPLEIEVVGFVGSNPGVSAGDAARAIGLPTSNFSRVLRRLVDKGLLRREPDQRDARLVHLRVTELAHENRRLMRDAWSASLDGALPDLESFDALNDALGRVDAHLAQASR